MRKYTLTLAAALAATATTAQATETGGGAYPNGAESVGVAQLPPPGTYLLGYSNYYTADRLNDANGKSAVPDFSVDAFANIARFVHVTDRKILGATFAMQAFVPVVDLTVHAAGARQHKFGLGDMIVNPFILGWNKGNLNIIATMDSYVPTGRYRKGDLANIGRNYWTFEPLVAITYADPKGGPEVSAKLMYDFNTKNKATDYRSGQEFHVDLAAAYNFNPLTVGVTAYYYKQTTDDKQGGLRVGPDGYKGEAFAAGPLIRYQLGHVPVTAQWQHEFHAENRPQGDKFWLKAAFRF
ncbi:transporter [Sphingobium sp. EM0848]|uniref:SphA family protein n=1 Tax=Sphingobium sp. EM0848 TaxID=2743473 RepID=UPI00159CA6EA|nr:transporter [Sphingobium sp. EM0848]